MNQIDVTKADLTKLAPMTRFRLREFLSKEAFRNRPAEPEDWPEGNNSEAAKEVKAWGKYVTDLMVSLREYDKEQEALGMAGKMIYMQEYWTKVDHSGEPDVMGRYPLVKELYVKNHGTLSYTWEDVPTFVQARAKGRPDYLGMRFGGAVCRIGTCNYYGILSFQLFKETDDFPDEIVSHSLRDRAVRVRDAWSALEKAKLTPCGRDDHGEWIVHPDVKKYAKEMRDAQSEEEDDLQT